jgi:hypothetical protein
MVIGKLLPGRSGSQWTELSVFNLSRKLFQNKGEVSRSLAFDIPRLKDPDYEYENKQINPVWN